MTNYHLSWRCFVPDLIVALPVINSGAGTQQDLYEAADQVLELMGSKHNIMVRRYQKSWQAAPASLLH